MTQSARFALPFLAPGQVQKEWFHNEALLTIDMLINAYVEAEPADAPTVNPVPGECFLVGPQPTGAWAGQPGALAGFTSGGWRFVAPRAGMSVLLGSTGETMHWRNGAWEKGKVRASELLVAGLRVVGTRQPAIADPEGGSNIDPEARAAVRGILAALRAHGLIET